jgi:hypothetical protein
MMREAVSMSKQHCDLWGVSKWYLQTTVRLCCVAGRQAEVGLSI